MSKQYKNKHCALMSKLIVDVVTAARCGNCQMRW